MAEKTETIEERAARIAEARKEVEAFDREQAEQARKDHEKRIEPLQELVAEKAFDTFMGRAKQLRDDFVKERRVYALLDAIVQAGEALPRAVVELAASVPPAPPTNAP